MAEDRLRLDVDAKTAMHIGLALAYYLPGLERACRRDGIEVPAELFGLASQLHPDRIAERIAAERPNKLAAARNRRSRARKRGEDVPVRRPGPAKRLAAG
jgi:hypothetical protein